MLTGLRGGDHHIAVLIRRRYHNHRVDVIARQQGRQAFLECAAPALRRRTPTLGLVIPDGDNLGIGVLDGLLGIIVGVNMPVAQHCYTNHGSYSFVCDSAFGDCTISNPSPRRVAAPAAIATGAGWG